jgi:hypothetical protein
MLRRRINMMERTINTSSKSKDKNKEEQKKQVWNGHGSYNPFGIHDILELSPAKIFLAQYSKRVQSA